MEIKRHGEDITKVGSIGNCKTIFAAGEESKRGISVGDATDFQGGGGRVEVHLTLNEEDAVICRNARKPRKRYRIARVSSYCKLPRKTACLFNVTVRRYITVKCIFRLLS